MNGRKRLAAALFLGLSVLCMSGCSHDEPVKDHAAAMPAVTTAAAVTTVTTQTAPAAATTTTTAPVQKLSRPVVLDEQGRHLIQKVPHYTQFSDYYTACEALAGVSLLRYYGIDMTPERFLNGFLPVADYPGTGADGKMYGESPWLYFIGDPMSYDGFGCYSGALVRGINKIKKGLAKGLRGQPLEKLCANYIDKGQPVIIWATMYMDYQQASMSWYLADGQEFTFMVPEHALVLIGYDEYNYYFSDSLQYENVVGYGREMTETAYNMLQMQAVVIDQQVLDEVPDFWRRPADVLYEETMEPEGYEAQWYDGVYW